MRWMSGGWMPDPVPPVTRPESGLPADRGTYILLLWLPLPAVVQVGSLGSFSFAAGTYAYVGSAFGPGGLRGRLRHHLAPVLKPHWHLDYLRIAGARVVEVWFCVSLTIQEHHWSDVLAALPGASLPVPRFGASDCTCRSHLYGFAARPTLADFAQADASTSTLPAEGLHCWSPVREREPG